MHISKLCLRDERTNRRRESNSVPFSRKIWRMVAIILVIFLIIKFRAFIGLFWIFMPLEFLWIAVRSPRRRDAPYRHSGQRDVSLSVRSFVLSSLRWHYSPNSTWLVTSRLDTCRASRDERVEPCCSTSSTPPKYMGSTRRTCGVVSCRDVTWRAKWNLGLCGWSRDLDAAQNACAQAWSLHKKWTAVVKHVIAFQRIYCVLVLPFIVRLSGCCCHFLHNFMCVCVCVCAFCVTRYCTNSSNHLLSLSLLLRKLRSST